MENNSDKLLRDKLSSTEFPFDPQAWEQMETMLDEKKKRRGFFWWWTGGIAAALLFGVIGYELRGVVNSKQLAVGKEEKSEVRNPSVAIGLPQTMQKSEANTTAVLSNGSEKSNISKQEAISGGRKSKIKNRKSEDLFLTKNQSAKADESTVKRVSRLNKSQQISRHKNSSKRKLRETTLAQLASGNSNENSNQVVAEENPFKKEIARLNAASAKASTEENIGLSRREASLLESVSENATTSFDKKEEDVLPKQKKKIFSYSLGCVAGVSYVTVGKQDWNTTVRFFPAPTYMVGLTNDFLFTQRVAVTAAVVFSQTSFIISKPKTSLPDNRMIYYSSKINELDIPIGIKVYPVVKNNFRFYIGTGIINHIKLKETFSHTVSNDTFAPNTLVSLADVSTLPDQTNFTGGYMPSALSSHGNTYSTKDFSINNAKRYYASFYAGAGFEFIAKKHFILFTEPMFYMSLQKIGVQDKRKYNIGLTGGFRYQF